MRGSLAIDSDGRFIRARFDDDATIADWYEAYKAHGRLVVETGIKLTLVDIRSQKASAPLLQLFEFALMIPRDVKFAVLAKPHDDHVFVETVAQNRGTTAKVFFGLEEEAVGWLLAPGAGP